VTEKLAASLQNVTVTYGERTVLDSINLDIVQGAITCLIGLSGAGKSTILRLINRLRTPTAGSVFVDGADVSVLRPADLIDLRQSIGFSFQFAALFDSLTIYDNVALPLRESTKLSAHEIDTRVHEVLSLVGLDTFANALPSELSGGMVKRAGFARAVVTRPHIVLYDEPTTGLDPIMTRSLTETIRRLQQRDKSTCVVVSHDLASIHHMADYIAMIYEGKIIAYGTRDQVAHSTDPRVQQFLEGRIDGPIRL
jgi:phospholipid/cholesterol/gamma-HCH transport system ATP-binding protein